MISHGLHVHITVMWRNRRL